MQKKITLRFIVFALTVFLTVGALIPLAAVSYPEKGSSPYVCDSADVLSSDIEERIAALAGGLETSAGIQLTVVSVSSLEGTDIDRYAETLYTKLKIGSSSGGILVLMSVSDENYWVTLGNGTDRILSLESLKKILLESLEPYFAVSDYNSAAINTVSSICTALGEGGESVSEASPGKTGNALVPGIFAKLLIAAVIIIAVLTVLVLVRRSVIISRRRRRRARARSGGVYPRRGSSGR